MNRYSERELPILLPDGTLLSHGRWCTCEWLCGLLPHGLVRCSCGARKDCAALLVTNACIVSGGPDAR